MTLILSHISFVSPAAVDARPRAAGSMYKAGQAQTKTPTPDALAMRHAP
jgi:hypothetical protein